MAQLGRVGITDVGQVYHSDHKLPKFRKQRRLEYAVAAALDCLLEQGLGPAVAGQLVRAAPQLLAFPGRVAMLFEGLVGRYGVAPDALARAMTSQPQFPDMANWADYCPTAEMLDKLLRGHGGLAALLKKQDGDCLPALYQLPEVVRQRLDYLCGRMPVPIQQAHEPLWQCRLVLTDRQLAQLVWQQPTLLKLLSERLQERVALLHSVLGMTGEEASRVLGSCAMYLTQDTGGRRQLLAWLVEFYGSQEAARAVVLKCPLLGRQNLESCQRNVTDLRRQLAEDTPQAISRKPQAMYTDLGGPLMAAKLAVFAAGVWMRWCVCLCGHSSKPSCQSIHARAGIPRSEHPHKFGYLLLGLPRLAVRLHLIKAHGLPLRLSWLNETDEVFCGLVGQEPAAFVAYKAGHVGSEPWLQLCAKHGLLPSGELPADQRRWRRQQRAQPGAAAG